MKNSISKFAIATTVALFSLTVAQATSREPNSPQIVKTTIVEGKIYPLINLPAVEVNASGNARAISSTEDFDLIVSNSAKMVKVEKHNGVYMPSVLLSEAAVVAFKDDVKKEFSMRNIFSTVFSFVYHYAAHFGVIH